jgi:hypothetical protein
LIIFTKKSELAHTAIVILNWNGQHYLEKFLPVLVRRSSLPGVSVVVADNGSTDGSVEWVKRSCPSVRLILFEQNYGFTGGYNRALDQIEADYFILINSDIEVTEHWLSPLIKNMDDMPQVGICMPKIRSHYKKSDFEYAGACGGFIDVLGYPFCRGRILSNIETDNGQYDFDREIFWASGACMMVRTSVFKELGGFEESFFAHMEEIDFCWRAKIAGWKIMIFPSSMVYHVGGGTLPNNSPRKLYLNYRNNLLMMYRNLPLYRMHITILIRMLLDGISAILYLFSGKHGFFMAVIKAHLHFWKMLFSVKRVRKRKCRGLSAVYRGSIVLSFFLSLKKIRFIDIEESITR